MEEETILGKINKKIKGIKETEKKKENLYKKTSEINFSNYLVPKTNLDKINKIFKIEKKQLRKKEDDKIITDFNNWLKKINAKNISFEDTEEKLYNKSFNIDLEILKKEFLNKKEEQKIEEEEDEDEIIDNFTEGLEEKKLQATLLNKEYFLDYEYKKNIKKNEILKTREFIFSFNKIKNLSKILKNDKLFREGEEEENNVNQDILDILKNRLDLLILDNGHNNYEEFIDTTLNYLFNYGSYFSKLKIKNKKNEKKNLKIDEENAENKNEKDKRDIIEKNEKKIEKKIEKKNLLEKEENKQTEKIEIKKINGFVRPRILVILNYKHEFFTLAKKLFSLSKNPLKEKESKDLENLYYSEENAFEDNFCVGISFKDKFIYTTNSLKKCDIIFGSVKYLFKKEDEMKSLLSSIEILFYHKLEINLINDLEMTKKVLKNINSVPEHKECTENLENVRNIFVNNLSKFFRQNIFYSEFTNIELNSLINRNCFNYRGILKMKNYYTNQIDNILKNKFNFSFEKINIKNLKTEAQEKFNYFKNQLWKDIRKDKKWEKSLLIVNNYIIYKKLKNYLREKHSPVGFISEHTPKNKIQGVFAKFNSGAFEYILMTERMLFFQICHPQRYYNIIFFNLPFFSKTWDFLIENFMFKEDEKNQIIVIFSKKDSFDLERIIGTDKCIEFINEKNRFKKLEL